MKKLDVFLKVLVKILFVLIIFDVIGTVCFFVYMSSDDYASEDGSEYYYNTFTNKASLLSYYCDDATLDNTEYDIVFPSTYNNCKIIKFGDSSENSPFYIDFDLETLFPNADDYYGADSDYISSISDEYTINYIYYDFNITLPDYLKSADITDDWTCVEYDDTNDKYVDVIVINYYFTITSDNDYFYTTDGVLYYKDSNEVVDYLEY